MKQFENTIYKKDKIFVDIQTGLEINSSHLRKKITAVQSYFKIHLNNKEEKIAFFLDNSVDYAIILIALFDIPVVLIPLNPQLNKAKVAYLLNHSAPSFLVTSQDRIKKNNWLKDMHCPCVTTEEIFTSTTNVPCVDSEDGTAPEKLKFILYTSGTTGNPKGVMLSKGAVESKIVALINSMGLCHAESFFSFLPFFSGHGMIPGLLVPFFAGCTIYISKFNPFLVPKFWNIIKKHRINYFTSVPNILLLLKHASHTVQKGEIPTLNKVFTASSPLPQAIYEWYRTVLGIKIINCYGLTETASWISMPSNNDFNEKAHCVGKTIHSDIGIFDDDGNRLDHEHTGEIWVQGPSNMEGYYKNSKETLSVLEEKFIKTGDIGYIDKTGDLFLLDRKKNIIIKKGINVYPIEIDQAFLEHEKVKGSVSFGIDDEKYGEKIITALVVHDEQKSKNAFLKYAVEKLPTYLIPDDIFFVASLPVGPTGKTLSNILKNNYINQAR
ncbi:MAG: acyl--CoA ligase [Candidatus Omnitrophica bacterium]|nr:acyl--CoA ligase [Candidatus Omnitrophota bacterium]